LHILMHMNIGYIINIECGGWALIQKKLKKKKLEREHIFSKKIIILREIFTIKCMELYSL
ncbi:hypothetical protein CWM98_37820, partial [Klebsiella variicola]